MLDPKKLQYEAPTIRLIRLAPADIITNSLGGDTGANPTEMFEKDGL